MTHYETLGITASATEDEIKQAYKKLAKQYHPDINKTESAAKRMAEINAAYDVLRDTKKRQAYDAEINQPKFNKFNDQFYYESPMNDFEINIDDWSLHEFNNLFRHRRKNKNYNVNYQISLEEAFYGKSQTLQVNLPNASKMVNVDIPRGVDTGSKIRLAGQGDNTFQGIPAGDLFINITVMPSKRFIRKEKDLYVVETIDAIDAILGITKVIKSIDGTSLSIKIPQGSQHGDILRIKGHGMTTLRSDIRGDLFVTISIVIPKNITTEQRLILQQYREKEPIVHK
ncbi:MAG: J domain-containing protein [Candidimonas sp.]